jgi:hypothetical protein
MKAMGKDPKTAEAISAPQNKVSALIRSLTVPTGMVFMEPEDMKIRA